MVTMLVSQCHRLQYLVLYVSIRLNAIQNGRHNCIEYIFRMNCRTIFERFHLLRLLEASNHNKELQSARPNHWTSICNQRSASNAVVWLEFRIVVQPLYFWYYLVVKFLEWQSSRQWSGSCRLIILPFYLILFKWSFFSFDQVCFFFSEDFL